MRCWRRPAPDSGGCGCCLRGWAVYFLLALGLFPWPGHLGVWAKLTAVLGGLGLAVPSPKALRDLRRRVGIAPVKALFEVLAGPLGRPRTPGVRFGRYRTVAFDGCRSLKVPDTPRNRRSEEHTSELQSRVELVCRLLLEKKKKLT